MQQETKDYIDQKFLIKLCALCASSAASVVKFKRAIQNQPYTAKSP